MEEVKKVFGLSEEDAIEFMKRMDETKVPNEDEQYFNTFMKKLPRLQYFSMPEPPKEPVKPKMPILTNIRMRPLPEAEQQRRKNKYDVLVKEYENKVIDYRQKLQQYEAEEHRNTPLNDEIYVNSQNYYTSPSGNIRSYAKGEFGMVKHNKSRPQYVYKFLNLQEINEKTLKSTLLEPLINCILQQDSVASPYICRVYKVYCREVQFPYGPGYQLAYKLENLDIGFKPFLQVFSPESKEDNKRILLKIYAPIYKILHYLRETYDFNHGDLHTNNLMFVKNPFNEDGTINESNLAVKIIDFGYSSLIFNGIQYGTKVMDNQKEFEAFTYKTQNILPENFLTKIKSLEGDHIALEKFILEEANTVAGGAHKRKTRRNKKRTTRKK